MKAIIKKEPKKGLWWGEVPMPQVGAHELLIKIETTSICGTDVHLYEWDAWAQKTFPWPGVIGHEFAGRVVEVGSLVRHFKVNDRVSGEGHLTCGHCLPCRTGQRVLCVNTRGIGVTCNGCFAEYLVIPEENAFALPDSIPNEIASIFDPLGNAVHTALSFDLVGQDVLITGAGPIGIMAIQVAKKAGARKVVITDLNQYRLNLARQMGADLAIEISKEDFKAAIHSQGISSFPIVLEMSGSADALKTAVEYACHGGKIVLLGILPDQATVNWHQVIFKMLTLKGIYGREIFKTWYQTLHMLESGLNIAPVITHRFKAEDFQKGFDVMLSGQSGKVILEW